DTIVVANRRHRERRRNLDDHLGFQASTRGPVLRAREVDDEQDGEFALLHIALQIRLTHPRGNVPVDRPDVVARLIGSHLGELDPLPLEDRVVLAGEAGVDRSPRTQVDPSYLTEDLARGGYRLAPH